MSLTVQERILAAIELNPDRPHVTLRRDDARAFLADNGASPPTPSTTRPTVSGWRARASTTAPHRRATVRQDALARRRGATARAS